VKIEKAIKSKVKRDYFFTQGCLDIDYKYFIKEIDKGVNYNNNASYKTHVRGSMTSPNYFLKNIEFIKTIQPLLDYIDDTFKNAPAYNLNSAWGYKEGFAEYTREHNHGDCWLSGVIYLNKHTQKLIFPEIKQEVTPEVGKFILFSPYLLHKTKRNITEKIKYGLAFNWSSFHIFDSI
tara:strand:- start:45 stop:578 length:534 start_codon:yes stop_codon:yes gene_type:complete